ncbi:MAG TPA: Asp-tRNA(Asn)/Glu-tRNA(Gln) amidotransferase subunit GatB [Methanoregulaceae archaeon]|nr:MAG: Asp-tRNA(Asn)/Glu-tRNA(Gln) amidotransferase subunit GatB [Methanolinea sp.]HON81257.1 Asp-tRNA(Asn)/Glu-tRNA(Gln) amidotransferase subunit GatB [Methanoregulaceae archaeon]HPD10137.1 Asp-tRNA(Asn)/Glu-tRNA(Gln) amidotransferase subunit GatB [Methanoregulaceae archaeon]HRT15143.1 Asp-tRNA(Asn)/Glu-tRNA(Gln) amidotransferase subunit GatB [Methanoregulaceae archaeon]HRU30740.1 Asp-tRNA(Asn)/Glu-tRNA(Gln) amidotransferase subunit GatB [Methanoregulaceae archaeon]
MKTIIGLEIHCQLDTKTKLFCGCSTDYRDDEPNTHVCPICLGLPGSLPRVNRMAVEYALRVGKALNCRIVAEAEFARKNYFYPDLNKGFQITQYDKPVAVEGYLDIEGDYGEKRVRITRVHMEEDPGRLVHKGGADRPKYTLVDDNRAGIPLIEIVTEPDLRSPKEARKFLTKLRATLEYLGVFDSEKEGSLRVDANISQEGHERVEVKNISSFKGVEKALTFEITRQRNAIRRGQRIARETRHFVEARGVTTSSRSKEMEQDYRYFPEPDLRPFRLCEWAAEIVLPELPDARRARFVKQYGCSQDHARTLTGELRLAEFYEQVAGIDTALAATWVADTLLGELNYRDMSIKLVPPGHFRELLGLLKEGSITDKSGVEVLRVLLDQLKECGTCEGARECVDRLRLRVISATPTLSGEDPIVKAAQEAIAEQPQAVADFQAGKKEALNFLVGQVMKKTRGCAKPGDVNKVLSDLLEEA